MIDSGSSGDVANNPGHRTGSLIQQPGRSVQTAKPPLVTIEWRSAVEGTTKFMTIFAWLFIGHLVGDWMLQNNWMARDKRGRWWSAQCIVHCLVYTVTIVLIVWAFGRPAASPLQLGILFVATLVTHWVIDGFNLAEHWGRIINQTQHDFVRIVVDQTMHLIVLAAVAAWAFG